MSSTQTLEVQQGIWIDKQWLQIAGLGSHLKVIIQSGEIRIITAQTVAQPQNESELGWDAFRSLGDNASPGKLKDASINHDRYLYGKER